MPGTFSGKLKQPSLWRPRYQVIWPEDVVELQMSHMEKNNVRAAYTHKVKHLEQRRLMLQWWADFPDANHNGMVRPFEFGQKE